MIRAYDDNGNVVDLVKWEKQIRAEAIKEIHRDLITEIDMLNSTDMTDTNLYAFAVKIKEITDKLVIK